jgi:hypothetical protein
MYAGAKNSTVVVNRLEAEGRNMRRHRVRSFFLLMLAVVYMIAGAKLMLMQSDRATGWGLLVGPCWVAILLVPISVVFAFGTTGLWPVIGIELLLAMIALPAWSLFAGEWQNDMREAAPILDPFIAIFNVALQLPIFLLVRRIRSSRERVIAADHSSKLPGAP